jgi:hypothetical protein
MSDLLGPEQGDSGYIDPLSALPPLTAADGSASVVNPVPEGLSNPLKEAIRRNMATIQEQLDAAKAMRARQEALGGGKGGVREVDTLRVGLQGLIDRHLADHPSATETPVPSTATPDAGEEGKDGAVEQPKRGVVQKEEKEAAKEGADETAATSDASLQWPKVLDSVRSGQATLEKKAHMSAQFDEERATWKEEEIARMFPEMPLPSDHTHVREPPQTETEEGEEETPSDAPIPTSSTVETQGDRYEDMPFSDEVNESLLQGFDAFMAQYQ